MTAPTPFAEAAVASLATAFGDHVIHPAHPEYDRARHVWNGMVDRRPAAIVRCRRVEDVRRALELARAHQLPVSVRGGGHNAAGLAVCDGGVVIDLSPMAAVAVDPVFRVARAQGGATWAQFDAATQAHGLATTGGAISSTGVAGLTLGGGLGWLMRSCGMACDNVVAAEVVTADGRVVTASATEHPDLFWAVRGGGGNFGVVTELTFRLHPVGPTVLGGMLVHPIARAPEVLRFFRDVRTWAPDELTVFCGLMVHPEAGPIVGLPLCYNGPIEQGEEVVRALRAFGPPIVDQVGPMPYVALQQMMDEAFPPGLQVYWRSDFVRSLDDAFLDAMLEQFTKAPSPLSVMLLEHFGGAVARVGAEETAFPHRDAEYNLVYVSRWPAPDAAAAEANVGWARGVRDAIAPYTTGQVYVNYLGIDEAPDRIRAAYGPTYGRLAAVKRQYDPENVFRSTQNITPATTA